MTALDASTPVGAVEIAERLGVARQTVDNWRQRGVLPEPEWTVGGRPAWRWGTVEAWARETGRYRSRAAIVRAEDAAAAGTPSEQHRSGDR